MTLRLHFQETHLAVGLLHHGQDGGGPWAELAQFSFVSRNKYAVHWTDSFRWGFGHREMLSPPAGNKNIQKDKDSILCPLIHSWFKTTGNSGAWPGKQQGINFHSPGSKSQLNNWQLCESGQKTKTQPVRASVPWPLHKASVRINGTDVDWNTHCTLDPCCLWTVEFFLKSTGISIPFMFYYKQNNILRYI